MQEGGGGKNKYKVLSTPNTNYKIKYELSK